MGLAEYFCRPLLVWISPNMAISQAKPYVAARAPAWQASPWGHSPSSSAPCAVPMRLSRIDQHIKDEPCAKQRALLGVSSSRFSSVSRGVRSAQKWAKYCSIFTIIKSYQVPFTVSKNTPAKRGRICTGCPNFKCPYLRQKCSLGPNFECRLQPVARRVDTDNNQVQN